MHAQRTRFFLISTLTLAACLGLANSGYAHHKPSHSKGGDNNEVIIIEGTIDATDEDFLVLPGPTFGFFATGLGSAEGHGGFSYSSFLLIEITDPFPGCEPPDIAFTSLRGSDAFVFEAGVLLLEHREGVECGFANDTFHLDAVFEVVGGTGLFAGAEGTVFETIDGAGPFPFPHTVHFEGTIVLDGDFGDDEEGEDDTDDDEDDDDKDD